MAKRYDAPHIIDAIEADFEMHGPPLVLRIDRVSAPPPDLSSMIARQSDPCYLRSLPIAARAETARRTIENSRAGQWWHGRSAWYHGERFEQGGFVSTIGSDVFVMPPQAVIMQMVMGGWIARVISEVSRLDIPDALKQRGPQSAAELVTSGVKANAVALERVLRTCAGFGLFTESADGKFGATDLSEVLTVDSAVSVKVIAEEVGGTWLRMFGGLGDGIRSGESVSQRVFGMEWWDYLNANPEQLERFGESMKSNSLNSLRGVLEKCDFGSARTVVDVAGGFGHMVVALLEKYPNLNGVLLDVPELIPVAKQKNPVVDPGVAARLEYVGANMFDGVPAADVYLLKFIMHDWDDERCVQILKNCHRSMTGQGRLICVDSVLPPMGDTSATPAKLMDLLMMLGIRGKERTRAQWEQLYGAAGFKVSSITPLHDNFGTSIVEGVKV